MPIKKLSPDLRTEVIMLEIILRQTEMLITNTLDTLAKLLEFKLKQEQRIPPLIKERNHLYKVIAKNRNPEQVTEAHQRLRDIGFELNVHRSQNYDYDAITKRARSLEGRIMDLIPHRKGRNYDKGWEK